MFCNIDRTWTPGWKTHPDGGLIGLGISPLMISCCAFSRSLDRGSAPLRAASLYRDASDFRTTRRHPPVRRVAEIHHGNPVTDVAHHAEIVRNKQIGQIEFIAQIFKQVDHLRLDRHVERRDRLVTNDEFRVHRQGPGNTDALTLTTRHFVRITVGERRCQTTDIQQMPNPGLPVSLFAMSLCTRIGSAEISPTFMRGFNETVRVLEDHLDLLADIDHLFRVELGDIRPSKQISPAVGFSNCRMQRPVVVLPQPDSPTTPKVSPAENLKLTPSTAFTWATHFVERMHLR